jgi:hypothetical protein
MAQEQAKKQIEIVLEGEYLKMYEALKKHWGIDNDEELVKRIISYLEPIKVEVEVPRNFYDCIKNEFVKRDWEVKEWIEEAVQNGVIDQLRTYDVKNMEKIMREYHLEEDR